MPDFFDSGIAVRTPSWHGKERLLADYPDSIDEARRLGGLEWEPVERQNFSVDDLPTQESQPIFVYSGINAQGRPTNTPADDDLVGSWETRGNLRADTDQMRVVRSDTGALLDISPKSRPIINNTETFALAEVFTGQPNVKIDTLGSCKGGQEVYATILLDEPHVIKGKTLSDFSETLPYLVLQNRHSYGGALRAGYLDFRIVCANTFAAAEVSQDRHGHTFVFAHTKNWKVRVDEAKQALAGLRDADMKYREVMGDLLDITISPAQREVFVQDFIPMPVGEVISNVVKGHVFAARNSLRAILEGPTTEPVAHTAYGLVQAAGEYLDHVRGSRNNDTKVGRQLLSPQRAKFKAITIARQAAMSA